MLLKKNKKIIAVVAILVIAILAFIGGQAYAKYITEVRGEGVAEVATWSFKVNGSKEKIQQINLASTCNNETLINNKIAPGTSGSFNIIVDATGSEVGIDYQIAIKDEANKPQNLKFIYNGVEYSSVQELEEQLSGTINANDEQKQKTINIGWKWIYETGANDEQIAANDLIDTQDALAMQNYTFTVSVTGTQVEPQE